MEPLTCDQVREALWPDPAGADAPDAVAHYHACTACQHFFAWQAVLGARLAGIRPSEAPALIRARVRLGIGDASRNRKRRPLWLAGLAAAALLISLLTVRGLGSAQPFAPAASYLAALPMDSVMTDRMEASTALSARLDMPLVLPEIDGAVFMGAEMVRVDGRMWAGARYRVKGMDVAYFALPMAGLEPSAHINTSSQNEWEVAVWEEPDGMRALAGHTPLTRDEVLMMATECRSKSLGREHQRS